MIDDQTRIDRFRGKIDELHNAFDAYLELDDLLRAEACLRAIGRIAVGLTHADVPRDLIGHAHIAHVDAAMNFAIVRTVTALAKDDPIPTAKYSRGH